MAHPFRRLARRSTDRLAAPYMVELRERIDSLHERFNRVEKMQEQLRSIAERTAPKLDRAERMLRLIYNDDAGARRRLHKLRRSEDYELAFTESEPLVSFILPTHTRYESLCQVALPSILNQTYSNVEVIVVGDDSPPEMGRAIAELGDPRVRFHNRTVRGPYPEDDAVRWYMLGSPSYNEGLSLARGRWITAMADDDTVRPNHTSLLVRAAQEARWEHCYGRHTVRYSNGEVLTIGEFPPRKGTFVLQASVYHSGLRFFQMNLSDPLYEEPNDWSMCSRQLEAGVRFGMIDEIVADKQESRYHAHSDWSAHGVPRIK
jgi:Glycosyl transferase family 2